MTQPQSSTKRALPPLPPLPISSTNPDVVKEHAFRSNAHWIIPKILMQGGRPGASSSCQESLLEQIRAIMVDAQCHTFVCLQAECEPQEGATLLGGGGGCQDDDDAANLANYQREVLDVAGEINNMNGGTTNCKPEFLHYGIINMKTAKSIDSLSNAVHDLASRIQSGENLYIHCWGGKGRAGIISTCLLGVLYPELDAEGALAYVDELCQLRNMDIGVRVRYHSPETEDQKKQVTEFFRRIRA